MNESFERRPELGTKESVESAAQLVLAAMMSAPNQPLLDLITDKFPGRDSRFYGPVLRVAKDLMKETIECSLQLNPGKETSPTLLERLSFTWSILRKADQLVRKLKPTDAPANCNLSHAEAAFRNILSVPLLHPLLVAILDLLRLGRDGRYLFHYSFFRRAKAPTRLPEPFDHLAHDRDLTLLRTVIWWCIRARKEVYVDVTPDEPVRIEFAYVVDAVLKSLKGWCGNDIERVPDITGEIERELNDWLKYSHLDPSSPDETEAGPNPEIAKAFVKQNEFKIKLVRTKAPAESDERVRQLEATIRQLAEELRVTEERLRASEARPLVHLPLPAPVPSQGEPDTSGFTELREVLKIIDAKYSFDTLYAVQLGEENNLTFRSFAMHLFYALRKRGFSEYPNDTEFNLSYEASGLYECDGFEVPPGATVPVKVARKGWALKARGRLLPIRRARVSQT